MHSTALPRDYQDWLSHRSHIGPRPRKPLRKVKPKRASQLRRYNKLLPGWIEEHPTCEIGPAFHAAGIMVKCNGRTTHPHHVKGRIGELLCDTRFFKASCDGECHPQAVHQTHKDAAIRLGLIQ